MPGSYEDAQRTAQFILKNRDQIGMTTTTATTTTFTANTNTISTTSASATTTNSMTASHTITKVNYDYF